jgi:hypothetical protein
VLVFSLHLHSRCWATGNWNTDANTTHRDTNKDFEILRQHRRTYTNRAVSGHLYGLIQFIYLIFTAWFYNTAVFLVLCQALKTTDSGKQTLHCFQMLVMNTQRWKICRRADHVSYKLLL